MNVPAYTIVTSVPPPDVRTVVCEDNGYVLYAVVQANDKQPSAYAGHHLNDAIAAAKALLGTLNAASSRAFAQHLGT